ncbi:hypothetical protein JCM19055_1144 [Geomicrobium sp. JCM 19055]|nr:hypothetical protein JCM19055_1144 [Geomicrobium sp. JCM 19055]
MSINPSQYTSVYVASSGSSCLEMITSSVDVNTALICAGTSLAFLMGVASFFDRHEN